MKKIFIFFIITINLYSIEFLFKDDVINCENFQNKKLFCSWGIGKNLDDAKDNFNQNTRIKFDYIFSKNRIRIYDSMTFQRLSRFFTWDIISEKLTSLVEDYNSN